MGGYLIYHPPRQVSFYDESVVFHDAIGGNQDPYVWNYKFLHTFCHITGMRPKVGQINFWVSGNCFPNFTQLYCDLVFVVAEKQYWTLANSIDSDDPIVDSDAAFNDHYRWASQHHFRRRHRYTLKADPDRSFQPQTADGNLLDIVPILLDAGLSLPMLTKGLRAGYQSKPMRLDSPVASHLYDWLCHEPAVALKGDQLAALRASHPELSSPGAGKTKDGEQSAAVGLAACACPQPRGQPVRLAALRPHCKAANRSSPAAPAALRASVTSELI